MKQKLQIIMQNNQLGLADVNNHEVVECVYDEIKILKNGKFIVIKDHMAGILSNDGQILLCLIPYRLHYFKNIDVFKYKENDCVKYFKFEDNQICYLNVEKLQYNSNTHIVQIQQGGMFELYNEDLIPIETGFDVIVPTDIMQGKSKYYLGFKNGKWGAFRVKYLSKKLGYEIKSKIEPKYNSSGEVLKELKDTRRAYKIKPITQEQILKENYDNIDSIVTDFDTIKPTYFMQGHNQLYLGQKDGLWGIFRIKHTATNDIKTVITIVPKYVTSDDALKALLKKIKHSKRKK